MDEDGLKREGRRQSDAWRARVASGVREARRRAKLTQGELADVVGVQLGTISKIETASVVPDYATLETIADVLHVTLDDLVGRIPPPAQAESGTGSPDIWELIARLNDRQAAVAESVDELSERIAKLEKPETAKGGRPKRTA